MQIRGDSSFCSPSEKGASTTGREQKLTWCPQCERPPRLFVCDFLKLRKLPPAPFFSNLHLKDTVFFSTSEMRVFCVKLQSGVNKGQRRMRTAHYSKMYVSPANVHSNSKMMRSVLTAPQGQTQYVMVTQSHK